MKPANNRNLNSLLFTICINDGLPILVKELSGLLLLHLLMLRI